MTVCGEKVTGVCVAGKCPYFKRCHPVVWDKYGKIKPKTNEEWLKSYNTAQLAAWIANEINERVKLALHDSELNDGDVNADDYMENADDWLEWLKEKR